MQPVQITAPIPSTPHHRPGKIWSWLTSTRHMADVCCVLFTHHSCFAPGRLYGSSSPTQSRCHMHIPCMPGIGHCDSSTPAEALAQGSSSAASGPRSSPHQLGMCRSGRSPASRAAAAQQRRGSQLTPCSLSPSTSPCQRPTSSHHTRQLAPRLQGILLLPHAPGCRCAAHREDLPPRVRAAGGAPGLALLGRNHEDVACPSARQDSSYAWC